MACFDNELSHSQCLNVLWTNSRVNFACKISHQRLQITRGQGLLDFPKPFHFLLIDAMKSVQCEREGMNNEEIIQSMAYSSIRV